MTTQRWNPSHNAVLLVGCIEHIITKNLSSRRGISELSTNAHLFYVPYLTGIATTTSLWLDYSLTARNGDVRKWERDIFDRILTPLLEIQQNSRHRKASKQWHTWNRERGYCTQTTYILQLFRQIGQGIRHLEPKYSSEIQNSCLSDKPIWGNFYDQMLLESLEITALTWRPVQRANLTDESFHEKFSCSPGFALGTPDETFRLVREYQAQRIHLEARKAEEVRRRLKAPQLKKGVDSQQKMIYDMHLEAEKLALQRVLNNLPWLTRFPWLIRFLTPESQQSSPLPQDNAIFSIDGPREDSEKPPPHYSEV